MIEPYYKDEDCVLYLGDCREILPQLEVKADLCLTDPPYGIGMERFEDDFSVVAEALNSCPADKLISFMSPRRVVEFAVSLSSWRFQRVLWMNKVADLSFPWHGWYMNSEAILVFDKPDSTWPRGGTRYSSDTYSVAPWGKAGHPANKPPIVIADLIQKTAANLILDPFAGSGTTLVAAKMLKRKSIGIEISQKYCDIIVNRLNKPIPLFEQPRTLEMFPPAPVSP